MRTSSPSTNSAKQIAHSANLSTFDGSYAILGKDSRAFFLRPLFEGGAESDDPARRVHAQRATAANPTTQIRAQSKAARMTMTSELTASGGSGGLAEAEAEGGEWLVVSVWFVWRILEAGGMGKV
jgi:hypothetical protein